MFHANDVSANQIIGKIKFLNFMFNYKLLFGAIHFNSNKLRKQRIVSKNLQSASEGIPSFSLQ